MKREFDTQSPILIKTFYSAQTSVLYCACLFIYSRISLYMHEILIKYLIIVRIWWHLYWYWEKQCILYTMPLSVFCFLFSVFFLLLFLSFLFCYTEFVFDAIQNKKKSATNNVTILLEINSKILYRLIEFIVKTVATTPNYSNKWKTF